MSKPGISISLGKPKTSISLPKPSNSSTGQKLQKPANGFSRPPAKRARLTQDSDSEDEAQPKHEEVTGFDVSIGGAISSRKRQQKEELVIPNAGNGDWRRRGRGRNLLPDEVKAQQEQQNIQNGATVEKDEVSTESGLQFVAKREEESTEPGPSQSEPQTSVPDVQPLPTISKEVSEDDAALQALLNDSKGERVSNRIIELRNDASDARLSEADDYKADVASRPESATLEEYNAMPVEEFGMALIRGMGQKRRANGEVITFGTGDSPKPRGNRTGYLGIGAKGVPAGAEIELGAWGKAAMRKNKNGEGLYTPILLKDKRTGEMLTEEELEARKKEGKGKQGEEDWRDRRDRNLKDRGGGDYRNGSSRDASSKRERSRSGDRDRRHRDRDRDTYESSSKGSRDEHRDSRRERDPDRDRDRDRDRNRDRDRDRGSKRDRYKEDDRYDSSSSRKSSHRERDGYDDRDKGRRHDRHRDDDRRRRDYR